MKNKWKPYTGTLNTRSERMSKLARKAQGVYGGQVQRCENPNCPSFKNYGGRGIEVEYNARDFVGWYMHNFAKRRWKMASVGRIDHDKNYTFDNIEMIEHADNAREMYERTGGNKTVERTPVVLVGEDKTIVFKDNVTAAKWAGVTPSLICLRKRIKARKATPKFPYEVYDFDDFMRLDGTI
jgi:hypothetical protein